MHAGTDWQNDTIIGVSTCTIFIALEFTSRTMLNTWVWSMASTASFRAGEDEEDDRGAFHLP